MRRQERRSTPSSEASGLPDDGVFHSEWVAELPKYDLKPGTLYIISTPVGNIEDISIRALRTLKSVTIVAAENPPRTRALLRGYGIGTPVTGVRSRKEGAAISDFLARLGSGETIALVSDAGTPLIADSGASLAEAAKGGNFVLASVPGPMAALVALTVSGRSAPRFIFDGFPPRDGASRLSYFAALASETRTIVLYESRALLRDTLKRLRSSVGAAASIVVARDLTKCTETLFYGTVSSAVEQFREAPSGEFTLVITPVPRLMGGEASLKG